MGRRSGLTTFRGFTCGVLALALTLPGCTNGEYSTRIVPTNERGQTRPGGRFAVTGPRGQIMWAPTTEATNGNR